MIANQIHGFTIDYGKFILNPDISKGKIFYSCENEPLLYTGALREVFLNNRPFLRGFTGTINTGGMLD